MNFLIKKLIDSYDLSENDSFNIHIKKVVCETTFKLPFCQDRISRQFCFVLKIALRFWNNHPGYPVSSTTGYFVLTEQERTQLLNQNNPSNSDKANFSSKNEALRKFFEFFNRLKKDYY